MYIPYYKVASSDKDQNPLLQVGELDPRAELRLSSEIPEDSLLSPLPKEPENGLSWLG